LPLGQLQHLNKLVLNKNKMKHIGSLPSPLFASLTYLALEGNCLKDNVCMFQLT
jgi:Leucine-rich repeat (LRR) protein